MVTLTVVPNNHVTSLNIHQVENNLKYTLDINVEDWVDPICNTNFENQRIIYNLSDIQLPSSNTNWDWNSNVTLIQEEPISNSTHFYSVDKNTMTNQIKQIINSPLGFLFGCLEQYSVIEIIPEIALIINENEWIQNFTSILMDRNVLKEFDIEDPLKMFDEIIFGLNSQLSNSYKSIDNPTHEDYNEIMNSPWDDIYFNSFVEGHLKDDYTQDGLEYSPDISIINSFHIEYLYGVLNGFDLSLNMRGLVDDKVLEKEMQIRLYLDDPISIRQFADQVNMKIIRFVVFNIRWITLGLVIGILVIVRIIVYRRKKKQMIHA
ncbi:MAG: hypothetical protein OEY49_17900 [Candidatus Heimdallarchaeota archaeon]|nr:hypothetical protein [Candidatus Heimdallarchaeota archaeon]